MPSPSGSASSISSGTTSSTSGASSNKSIFDQKSNQASAKGDEAASEAKPEDEDDKSEENKQPNEPELTEDQQKLLDGIMQEMRTLDAFHNNPGQPTGELKLLDGDALDQLESRLSIDDQCVRSSSSWGGLGCTRIDVRTYYCALVLLG